MNEDWFKCLKGEYYRLDSKEILAKVIVNSFIGVTYAKDESKFKEITYDYLISGNTKKLASAEYYACHYGEENLFSYSNNPAEKQAV